jgi:hypothetical protein
MFRPSLLWAMVSRFFVTAAVQHGNVRLPEQLERWLQPMLVATDLHRIHHSISFDQANSNYGAVLSFWGRLFGTYRCVTRAQHESIVFGVPELPRRDCVKPSVMLLTPWLIYRGPLTGRPKTIRAGPRSPTRRQRREAGGAQRAGVRTIGPWFR